MIYFLMSIYISVIQTFVGVVHAQPITGKKGCHQPTFRWSYDTIGVGMIHQTVLLFIDAK